MARLKLCLMVHYEDDMFWKDAGTPAGVVTGDIKLLASLATVVGNATGAGGSARGAKISMQSDVLYLNQNNVSAPDYPGGPTSLSWLFSNGGNLWCHTHSGSLDHLTSVRACVGSAYSSENGVGISVGTASTAGRSGGPDPSDAALDWALVCVSAGIRKANAPTIYNYATMSTQLRPYAIDYSTAVGKAYFHNTAPGPLDETIPATMRQRPFWVEAASIWDARIDCIYPSAALVSSLIMIPYPGRASALSDFGGRTAVSSTRLSMEDFNAALTNIWTTWQMMDLHQNSITNVWYVHVPPDLITSAYIDTFGAWVDSINALMLVNAMPNLRRAEWKNMNEITDVFSDTRSFNY